jgi:anti-sigma regulatory factor (Ser/Thr protein kinase)
MSGDGSARTATDDGRRRAWDAASDLPLELALGAPVALCIDAASHVPVGLLAGVLADASLTVCLATTTAYRNRAAYSIVAALARRLGFGRDLADRIETALHEALMNAVIHGNLGLSSASRDDLDGCVDYELTIARLLDRADLARRPVVVAARWLATEIELTISDECGGFDATARPAEAAGHGRGLLLINALADRVSLPEDGRGLVMGFHR